MRNSLLAVLLLLSAAIVRAEDDFERAPIEYSRSTPDNAVSQLQRRLDRAEVTLKFDDASGYLPALLRALHIPVESQMLVFSKTSMQRDRIAPKTPRAIYFNDDVYVGFCHAGQVLEVSAADPALGAVFYTLEQKKSASPALVRQTQQCLQCHSSSQSGGVPSHLVRSVFTASSGLPILSEGGFRVDHTTPLEDRWGGWYVSGSHGRQTHLGNLIVKDTPITRPVQNPDGHNVADLSHRFSAASYLTPDSDIVALMVFEHQTYVQNLIASANFATRQALHYEAQFNRELGEPADHRLESTTRRIASAGDQLVKGLLFVDEAPLAAPIAGTSQFTKKFASKGPRDELGRSLREFDLSNRLFKHPCSYQVYSAAFDGLPREMKIYVASKLQCVLAPSNTRQDPRGSQDDEKSFAHLTQDDRRAIWEILSSTKPEVLKP